MENRTLIAIPLIIGSLLLPLGCGGGDDPTGPNALFCSDHPASAIATFEDVGLEAGVRAALSVDAQADLTCGLISGLTGLDVEYRGGARIENLRGIENLTSLTDLNLSNNSITDISPLSGLMGLRILTLDYNLIRDISALSGLTSLTTLQLFGTSITDISPLSGLMGLTDLFLHNNSITDISALSGLTSLTYLELSNNPDLSNIQPLLNNTGFGAGDYVALSRTNVSCTGVFELQAKGVSVTFCCTWGCP